MRYSPSLCRAIECENLYAYTIATDCVYEYIVVFLYHTSSVVNRMRSDLTALIHFEGAGSTGWMDGCALMRPRTGAASRAEQLAMSKSPWKILRVTPVSRRAAALALGAMLLALLTLQVLSPGASLHAQSGTAPAPSGLNAGSPTETTISLSWNTVTDAERYKVEYGTSSSGPWADAFYDVGVLRWTARALVCGTTYYFRAKARGNGSTYSTDYGPHSTGSVSETTRACPIPGNRADAPTGLTLRANATQSEVQLAWNVVPGAYRYKVERSTSRTGGQWSTVRFEYRLTIRNDDRAPSAGTLTTTG